MPIITVQTETGPLELNYSAADVITFPEGLIGCPEWCRFLVLEDDEPGPVGILQSLDRPEVALLVVDPEHIWPGYREHLLLPTAQPVVVLVTLTRQPDGALTANLLGPLVIDPVQGTGRQIVLGQSDFASRHPVEPGLLVGSVSELTQEGDPCSS